MTQEVILSLDLDRISSKPVLSFMKNNLAISNEELKLFTVGTGEWEECFNTVKDFTKTSESYFKKCKSTENVVEGNCPDDGIHLPSVLRLEDKEFYGFSEFWYTMEDVLRLGGSYDENKYKNSAKVKNIPFLMIKWLIVFLDLVWQICF